MRNVKVEKSVAFKVNLNALLRLERATLAQVWQLLREKGASDDVMNPSSEYLHSMHPPSHGPNARIANMPEEVGVLDNCGNYQLKGEWIEAMVDPKKPETRPRSKTVILYFHGARDVGPGTRVFSVEYRMAPENLFPAAIHDAFAAYLYLTEPTHAALTLDKRSASHHVPVWGDVTSSLPAANNMDWYCYCPGPIGNSPFDKKAFLEFNRVSIGANYVIGDVDTVPNPRNALGDDRRWLWYKHLAQHPLVSPVHRANLSGVTNTIVHTGTHDRLLDDNRLYAHRLGLANPDRLTRIEVYRDMVHVHHVMTIFPDAHVATANLARFVARSKHLQDQQELMG
ncbi:hypothetical protein BGZ74_011473, partial [Mortierella antarctica]